MAVASIAVIVPTRGNLDLTDLVAAVRCQTRPASELFIIEDHAGRGCAWARNRGIERSSAELLSVEAALSKRDPSTNGMIAAHEAQTKPAAPAVSIDTRHVVIHGWYCVDFDDPVPFTGCESGIIP